MRVEQELSSPVGRGRGYPPHAAAGHLRRPHALPDREEWARNTLDLGPSSPVWHKSFPSLNQKPNEATSKEEHRRLPSKRAVALTESLKGQSLRCISPKIRRLGIGWQSRAQFGRQMNFTSDTWARYQSTPPGTTERWAPCKRGHRASDTF